MSHPITQDEIKHLIHEWGGMKQQFFDESHLYNLIELVSASENQAMVRSVVTWEANTRETAAPRCTRIKAVIHQSWELTRSAKTGKPTILRQVVDKLDFLPGFAPPGPFPAAPHLTPPHPHKT